MKQYRVFLSLLFITLLGVSAVMADAVIATSVVSGNPYTTNSVFVVEVAVVGNDTGSVPTGFDFYINYNSNACTILSVSDVSGNIFNPVLGSEEGSAPNNRRYVRGEYLANIDSTPALFRMTCQTSSTLMSYDILMSDGTGMYPALYYWMFFPTPTPIGILHSYDNSGTTSLPVEIDWFSVD